MNKTMKKFFLGLFSAACGAVFLNSCTADEPSVPSPGQGDGFSVTAAIAREVHTKAYQAEGFVRDGIYHLSYPALDGSYAPASVNFHLNDQVTPGIGIVTVGSDEDLKWINVGGGPTPTFYLDNVFVEDPLDGSDDNTIIFGSDNPYRAALFDSEDGSNDLLWGESTVSRGAANVNFDLHHNMSRLRVEVTVDRTNMNLTNNLDIRNAKVEISSLNQTPLSYDRLTGDLALDTLDLAAYTPLTLVDFNQASPEWGDSVIVSEKDPDIVTYITRDFVLPPQRLLDDANRPRLTITMPDNTEYSGILPHAMEIKDETASGNPYPVSLYFLKEYILTIRTVITEEPPSLQFMPVWVVKWVDKGEFSIEAHQSGIYTPPEFYQLIAYYADNNEYQLVRYGALTQDKDADGNAVGDEYWHFDFFSSVILSYDRIAGMMHPGVNGSKPFVFNFNGFGVGVSDASGEVKMVNANQLYRIVTGNLTWNNI